MIKRSRVAGDILIISVRPDDVPVFSKINGFSFTSTHGDQKLSIQGSGVRHRSPTESTPASSGSNETIDLLKGFLERRYDTNTKLLNLSSITEDEKINAAGMFASTSRQSKFIPVLMTIIDQQLKTAEAKREAIQSVTLSNNNLPNVSLIRDIAITLPHIKNLDLSGNKFTSTRDLAPFKSKFRDLEHLIVSGNPFDPKSDWEKEIIKWYPRLRILNGQTVRTDAQIARLDAPKITPLPGPPMLWEDTDGIGERFLAEFFPSFDSDRNALVQKWYDEGSTFTMSVNTRARGGAGAKHDKTPWDSYLPQSRNLKIIHNRKARFGRKCRGAQQIAKAFSSIPATRHPELNTTNYSMDCHPVPGLPDGTGQYPTGVTGLMVVVHGEYQEHRTAKGADEVVRRAFDRTFTLGPGGPTGIRIITDMWSLRAAGGTAAWIPQPGLTPAAPVAPAVPVSTQPTPQPAATPAGLTPEQEAMVLHVHQATKLTVDMATQCLIAANWDLDTAAQIFNAQKDNLPPDAFVAT
jgi:nuclear RNA export factor